jgi:transcriptional regulator of heat shock response
MLSERGEQILEAVVRGFIETREPISSGWLYREYDFGIKPAMIRLELDILEREGYLEQPYHSAGRIPSDLGYEFLAGRLLDEEAPPPRQNIMRDFFLEEAWHDLISEMSHELGLLGVIAAHDDVYKTGLERLVDRLDWENPEEIRSVIKDFEGVDDRAPRAAEQIGEGLRVFIGRKSPVTRSESLAVIGASYRHDGAAISVFAIGPKCMDYKKAIKIFKNLS